MTHSLSKINLSIIIGAPFLIILFLTLLVKSSALLNPSDELVIAITFDLIFLIPLVYFLSIRKTSIPNISTVYVFLASLFIAGFILPEEHQGLLGIIKTWAIPIIEIAVIGFLLLSVKRTINGFKANKTDDKDFYDTIRSISKDIFPSYFATIISTEVAIFYYSFFSGKAKELSQNEFSYSRKSGIKSAIAVIIFLILIEAFAAHIVIQIWSHTFALLLTILSIYTCIQFLALIRSLEKRPIIISYSKQKLILRYGLYAEAVIPLDQIKEVIPTKTALPEDNSIIQFSPFGLFDSHNIILHLKEENTIFKMYGMQKQFSSIAFYLDDREEFIRQIEQVSLK